MNLTAWAWLLLPLGVCRAVQIALVDRIFEKPRAWLLTKLNPKGLPMAHPDRGYLSYLLECPWCISIWVAALAVGLVAWDATRAGTMIVLAVLTLSLLAVVLDRIIDRAVPDQPHATEGTGPVMVEEPPAGVTEAFAHLSGDDQHGSS